MTDETPNLPDFTDSKEGEAPRNKRASIPRPKKQAKPAKPDENPSSREPAELEVIDETPAEPAPASGDWPEPEPPSSGGTQAGGEGGKRKRRRKKSKGGKPQEPGTQADAGVSSNDGDESSPRPAQPQRAQPQQARPKLDPEAVAKLACKIYLAEVGEEGVALIGDADAKELARRCFRLSEIFLEEQARRR